MIPIAIVQTDGSIKYMQVQGDSTNKQMDFLYPDIMFGSQRPQNQMLIKGSFPPEDLENDILFHQVGVKVQRAVTVNGLTFFYTAYEFDDKVATNIIDFALTYGQGGLAYTDINQNQDTTNYKT